MPPEIFVVPNPFGFLVTIVQYVYFPLLWQLTFVGTVKLASSGGLLNHLIMEHNTSSAGEAEVHCPTHIVYLYSLHCPYYLDNMMKCDERRARAAGNLISKCISRLNIYSSPHGAVVGRSRVATKGEIYSVYRTGDCDDVTPHGVDRRRHAHGPRYPVRVYAGCLEGGSVARYLSF